MKKVIEYSTQMNYIVGPRDYEPKSKKPSLTIPDQAYSIKQILEYSKKGIGMPLLKKAIFEEENFPDGNPFRKQNLDLTDIDNLKENVSKALETVDRAKKEREAKKLAKQKLLEKQAIIEEYERSKQKE